MAASAEAAPYQQKRGAVGQRALLDGLALPPACWRELASHAADSGLVFLSTAFDEASLDEVLEVGVPALKVPSGELDNLPFLRRLAACGRPLLVSTGLATLEEVARAMSAVSRAPAVALLHCVTAYPAPVSSCNLRSISTMQHAFGVPVGWSDHTEGAVTAVAAVALGSALFEKHLTLDRAAVGPDHAASADPDDFSAYVRAIRDAEAALGDGEKAPADVELPNREHVRRSWRTLRACPSGQVLTATDVGLLRPTGGLPPEADIVGRRLRRDLPAGAAVTEDVLLQ